MEYYDLVIIGGGINGAAIAADAAGRGLKVFLCEKNDFASGTSSASSKLIHGGLRYLEQREFKLVKESLHERSVLLRRAPNLVYPLTFVMPDNSHFHSPWLIRAGLFLYDFFAGDKSLPKSKRINLSALPMPSHLKSPAKGFSYTDCWGDDARLVIANLQLAQAKGAVVASQTEFMQAIREREQWLVFVKNKQQHQREIYCKTLINAAGPWAEKVDQYILPLHMHKASLKLVKGSHIVIKRFYEGEHAFILQNEDGRIVFLIPFENNNLIIGTTDVPYEGIPENVKIDASEISYLKAVVERYFDVKITTDMIQWHYSGVRPLYNNHKKEAAKLTRDYYIALDDKNHLPLITLYGGKLTTHRCLAESVLAKLKPYFPAMGPSWTEDCAFPGSEFPKGLEAFLQSTRADFNWLPETLCNRLMMSYGTHMQVMLKNCHQMADLGHHFGAELYEAEVRYLIEKEWAYTADDILWRRSKLGLYLKTEQIAALNTWLRQVYSI